MPPIIGQLLSTDDEPDRDDLVDELSQFIGPNPPSPEELGYPNATREDTISRLFARLRELTGEPAGVTSSLPPASPPPPRPVIPTPATDIRGLSAPGTLTGFAAEARQNTFGFRERGPSVLSELLQFIGPGASGEFLTGPGPVPEATAPTPEATALTLEPSTVPTPVSAPVAEPVSDDLSRLGGVQPRVLPTLGDVRDPGGPLSTQFRIPSGYTAGQTVNPSRFASLYPTIYGDEGTIVTPEQQYLRHLEGLYGR